MRRCGAGLIVVGLAFQLAAVVVHAQSPRTRPLPVTLVSQGKANPAAPEDPLLKQVKLAIELNQHSNARRILSPENHEHTPWMIMHGLLALREDYVLRVGNQPMNAIDYITKTNPTHQNAAWKTPEYWFEATAYGGRPHPYIQSFAFEGHVNQFLAIMSMSNIPLTHGFKVRDPQRPGSVKTITMSDMVNHAKLHVNNREEVSWTLWFLSNYLEPDAEWINKDGQKWSMEQLVTMQVNASLTDRQGKLIAPCGGTHGMFALACACNSYQLKHGQLRGAWLAARQKLNQYIAVAQQLQNRNDGSFSTEFFLGRGISKERGVRYKTTGHMLEWLMMALPPERLQEPWIRSATMCLANDLVSCSNQNLEIPHETGAMYHALHAMVLYRNRFQPPTAAPVAPPMVAEIPNALLNPPAGVKPPPIAPSPVTPGTMPSPVVGNVAPVPVPDANANPQPNASAKANSEGRIRLLNPPKGLTPNRRGRLHTRPITDIKKPDGIPATDPPLVPVDPKTKATLHAVEPGKLPLLVPTVPSLEKPEPKPIRPMPVASEPKPEGAAVATPPAVDEGAETPVPLFNEIPEADMPVDPKAPAIELKPAPEPPPKPPADEAAAKPAPTSDQPPVPLLVPSLGEPSSETPNLVEPTPPKAPSSSD